nr:MAG: polymerase PB2 [Wuhan Mosquito Virus 6]
MDLEQRRKEALKKRFLEACRMVTKMPEKSDEYLTSIPICNLRQLERLASSKKDPVPVLTTQSNISEEYPISVNLERAKECGMPSNLLGRRDTHSFGRVVCKKEAIDWFIDNSEVPAEELKSAIDVIYRTQRRMAEDYYRHDWERAHVKYGPHVMRRETVCMNKVIIDIPLPLRVPTLIAALFPNTVVNWETIDKGFLDSLRIQLDQLFVTKLPILHQMRLLINMMDPRIRTLPVSPSLPKEIAYFRHAFSSPLHMVRVLTLDARCLPFLDDVCEKLGRIAAWQLNAGADFHDMRRAFDEGTVRGVSVQSFAVNCREPGVYKDVLRSLYGLPCPQVVKVQGAVFLPQEGRMRCHEMQNQSNRKFYTYVGRETVAVEYRGQHYTFVRDGSALESIKAPAGSGLSLTEVLCRIAVFIKHRWAVRKGGLERMRKETQDDVKKRPWDFLTEVSELTFEHEYLRAVRLSENFGIVEFIPEVPTRFPMYRRTVMNWPLIKYEGGSIIKVDKPDKLPVLDETALLDSMLLVSHLTPLAKLRKMVLFYMNNDNYCEMVERAYQDDWEWKNEGIRDGVTGANKEVIHATARGIYISSIGDDDLRDRRTLILAYMFASNAKIYVPYDRYVHTFAWYGGVTIDLRGTTGAVQFRASGIVVNGQLLEGLKQMKLDLVTHFAPGWRLMSEAPENFSLSPFSKLANSGIRNGRIVSVTAYGQIYHFMRDTTAVLEYEQTIQRQLKAYTLMAGHMRRKAQKRPAQIHGLDDEEAGPSGAQRPRLPLPDEDSDSEGPDVMEL